MNRARQVVLVIMDGWGIGKRWGGNAVYNSAPPFYRELWRTSPWTTLGASGTDVGLLPLTAGNSEAGHVNIGAGRIVGQDLAWITKQIESGQFARNPVLNEMFAGAKNAQKPLHIVGLLSDGGTHAQIDHLYALCEIAARYQPMTIYFHIFGDGRDTEPHRILILLDRLQKRIAKYKAGEVASIIGRYYAMDRDRNFDRTRKAYDLLTSGRGEVLENWAQGINNAYWRGITDEFLPPMLLGQNASQSRIRNGDFVIITNFRADRIWQLESSLVEKDFTGFAREPLRLGRMVSLVPIETAPNLESAMQMPSVNETMGEIISRQGWGQLRVAESEKGAHATYFLNGGRKQPYSGQVDQIIPSPKKNYADVPEMSAYSLLPMVEKAIGGNQKFIFLNLANPDMVGHTGNIEAGKKAVRIVDDIISKISQRAAATGTSVIITADHGNIDEMIIPYSGERSTNHSSNQVPFFLVGAGSGAQVRLRRGGRLCDIAPTILHLMGLQKPPVMTGRSLIV